MKSHYLALIHSDVPNLNKQLWKLKVPLKIKIFLWYLRKEVVLTKDNLAKQNWKRSYYVAFVTKMRQFRTCSSTALLLVRFGVLFK
jgi:hypothetical protein